MGILGPPYCGIGATIRIGREMLCLPYAGFFVPEMIMDVRPAKVCNAEDDVDSRLGGFWKHQGILWPTQQPWEGSTEHKSVHPSRGLAVVVADGVVGEDSRALRLVLNVYMSHP